MTEEEAEGPFFSTQNGYITIGALVVSVLLCVCTWCCCVYGCITTALERLKSTQKINKQRSLAKERIRHANNEDDDTSMIDRSAVALKTKGKRRKNIVESSD